MKIPMSILASVAAGVFTVSSMTSCGLHDFSETSDQVCEESCSVDHDHKAEERPLHYDDCPGCGMG